MNHPVFPVPFGMMALHSWRRRSARGRDRLWVVLTHLVESVVALIVGARRTENAKDLETGLRLRLA